MKDLDNIKLGAKQNENVISRGSPTLRVQVPQVDALQLAARQDLSRRPVHGCSTVLHLLLGGRQRLLAATTMIGNGTTAAMTVQGVLPALGQVEGNAF